MFGNLLFGLTFLTYIALSIFNLQKVTATGERLVGWGMIAFAIIAAYVLSSLLLTIAIAAKGGFNWLFNDAFLRNTAIAVLWFGMVAGVAYCTILKMEFSADNQLPGLARLLTVPIYYGALWLPLLMLLPYALLLNPEWLSTLSPNLYKIPLVLGCAIGWFIISAPRTVITKGVFRSSQLQFYNSMLIINNDKSIESLLPFTAKDEDERLRNAALTKIKAHADWETELIRILERNSPYANYWVYVFLNENKLTHPEQFIEPLNNSIPVLSSRIYEVIHNQFSRYAYRVELLKTDVLCRVLEGQFKDSSPVFRPNLLKLQEVLETPPLGQDSETRQVTETLNKYRLDVQNWLDSH